MSQKGFIQKPILIAIVIGLIVVGGAGYFGAREYQGRQTEQKTDIGTRDLQNEKPSETVTEPPPIISTPAPVEPTIKISPAQNNSSNPNTPSPNTVSEKKKEEPPVLKNLGVNIEPWDRQTNRAGDLIFSKELMFDDGQVFMNKPFFDFGLTDKYHPEGRWIEYWFVVPLGTKLRAPADGVISTAFFAHTQDWGINIQSAKNSSWNVSFEHVVNLTVSDGQTVTAGDIIGEAAPRNTYGNRFAMTELAVWQGGEHIIKYCPYDYLAENLKPSYRQKLNQLAADWEEFLGQDVYSQEKWVSPGCLAHSIIEK